MKCILKMTLLAVVVLCCLNPLSAQEEKTTEYAVKLYYNNVQPNARGYLTPSLLILKPKASHEFELSRLRMGTSNGVDKIEGDSGQEAVFSGGYDYNFAFSLKYEYGFKFLTINEKFDFSLHASVEPYFNFSKRNINSDYQVSSGNTIGGQVHLIPRSIYALSERWFVDVNFPIQLMNISRAKSYSENSGYERISIRNRFDFFDNVLRLRVGIGLKL